MRIISKTFKMMLVFTVLISNFITPFMTSVSAAVVTKGEMQNKTVTSGSFNDEGDIEVIKTLTKVNDEGKYHIDFNVKGKQISEEKITPVYAVIVFDTSGSMICNSSMNGYSDIQNNPNGTIHYTAADGKSIYCRKKYGGEKISSLTIEKWENAVNGAISFIDEIVAIPNSKVSLVTFESNANNATPWQNSSFEKSAFTHPNGGTDLGGALYNASGKLKDKTIPRDAKKVIIVISDGEPTYYKGSPSFNASTEAIREALTAKNLGQLIYTIGYGLDENSNSEKTLESVSGSSITNDKTKYNYLASVDTINGIFEEISKSIDTSNAGINALLTDTITSEFTYVSGENGVINSNQTVTYDIGNITEEGTTFGFDIEINPDTPTGWYDTNQYVNDGVKLTYTDPQGNVQKLVFTNSPKVYWIQNEYQYTINYYKEELNDTKLITTTNKKAPVNTVIDENVLDITTYQPTGYRLKETNPTSITISKNIENNVINVIYQKITGLSYDVKYLDYDTNKEIIPKKTIDNKTFGEYVIEKPIDIDGYNILDEKEKSINIDLTDNEIIFYYTKRNDLTYTVRYIEDGTNEVLHKQKEVNDIKFDTIITSNDEIILIDGYNYNRVDKDTLTIGTSENIITIYYSKASYEYTINYYFDDIKDQTLTENLSAVYKETINNYIDKCKEGYQISKIENTPLEINSNEEKNIINVYYKKVIIPKTGLFKNYGLYSSFSTISLAVLIIIRKRFLKSN